MHTETDEVSIRYTLSLEDGTPVTQGNLADARYQYTPGQAEIMPVLETALDGLKKGDTREIVYGLLTVLLPGPWSATLPLPGPTVDVDAEPGPLTWHQLRAADTMVYGLSLLAFSLGVAEQTMVLRVEVL